MTVKTTTLVALALVLLGSTGAHAKWVVKSDSWCRKHGFNPPCEVYEKDKAMAKAKAATSQPKHGEIRGTRMTKGKSQGK